MICTVYWRKGGFIVVPDCIRASHAVEHLYGPLRYCGKLETAQLPADLAAAIERDIDAELFSALDPGLAIRLGYEAVEDLPLPAGFAWREGDWWDCTGEISLVFADDRAVALATIARARHGGWICTTNRHRPWAFQGSRVCGTRAAAMQYVAMWADDHAVALRAGVADGAVSGPSAASRGFRPAARLPE